MGHCCSGTKDEPSYMRGENERQNAWPVLDHLGDAPPNIDDCCSSAFPDDKKARPNNLQIPNDMKFFIESLQIGSLQNEK